MHTAACPMGWLAAVMHSCLTTLLRYICNSELRQPYNLTILQLTISTFAKPDNNHRRDIPRVCPKYHHRHLRSRMYFFRTYTGVCPYRTLETSSDTLITPTVGTYPVYVRNTTTTPTIEDVFFSDIHGGMSLQDSRNILRYTDNTHRRDIPRVCPKYHHRHLR